MNAEFVSMTDAELAKKMADLKSELFNLRFAQASGSLANPIAIRDCRKNIARVATEMRKRELGLSKAPAASEKPAKKVAAKAEAKAETKTEEKKTAAKKVVAKTAEPKKQKAEKIMV